MRCAQIRHRAFLKKLRIRLRSGGRSLPQGHMVKCMRVLPCYMGGVWAGRSPPQGHSPNDMVICVCNLPYWGVFRGPLGVLGGPVGVQRGQGASWEGWGGPREVPEGFWGGPWKWSFSFFLEVNLSMVPANIDVFSFE